MSYAYDVMASAFRHHIAPRIDQELAHHFSDLIEEMHSANHGVPSADGIFKSDGINKHAGVSRAARELDECVKKLEKKGASP